MISFHLLRRLAFAGLAITAAPLFAADFTSTWTGGSDLWSTAAHWDTPGAPGTFPNNGAFTYDAILSNGSAITLGQNITIEKFTLVSSTVAGSFNLTLNDDLTWTGGVMSGNGTTSASGGAVFGDAVNFNQLFLDERTLNLAAGQTAILRGVTHFYLANGATINNAGTFLAQSDYFIGYNGGGPGTFNNTGTFTRNTGTGTFTIGGGVIFNNTGTVNVATGVMALQGGDNGSTTGDFNIALGATLNFQSNFDLAATADITGAGTAQFSGGTVNLLSSTVSNILVSGGTANFNATTGAASVTLSSGTLGGSGTLNVGSLTWAGGYMSGSGVTNSNGGAVLGDAVNFSQLVLDQRTLNLAAGQTATLQGLTYFYLQNGATINNAGTFLAQSDYFMNYNGGAPVIFNNSGVFTRNAGTGTFSIGAAFNNTGMVNVLSGVLTLQGGDGGSTTGDFQVASGAVLNFQSNFDLTATADITGTGTAQFSGGTVNVLSSTVPNIVVNGGTANFNAATGASSVTLSGGTLGGSGTLNVGSLTWAGGVMRGSGVTNVNSGAVFGDAVNFSQLVLDERTLNLAAGQTATLQGLTYFYLQNGATINNAGTFLTQSDYFMNYNGGAPVTFNNSGVLTRNSGTGTFSISGVILNNTGTVNIQTGTLALGGGDGGSTTGDFHIASGAVLNFQSNFNFAATSEITGAGAAIFSGGTSTVNGTYNVTGASYFTGATVTFAAPVTSLGTAPLTVTGGAVNFNSTTPALGGIHLTGGVLGGSGTVTTTGNLDWTGGQLTGSGMASVAGLASTIGGVNQKFLGRVLTNTGTMTYGSSDGHTLYFGPDAASPGVLNNNGTFRVAAGGDFSPNYAPAGQAINNAGIWNVSGLGTISNVSGGIAFHNTGTVNVLSGGLALGGGDSSGTTGAFNVGSGGTLNFTGGDFTLGAASSISGAGAMIFSGGTTTVNGTFNIRGGSYFTGATVTFNAPVASLGSGPLTVTGGAVYFNSTTPALGGIYLSGGTLGGSGTITTTGSLDWTSGVMNGGGTTSVAGGASTIGGGSQYKWLGRLLTNSGTMTFNTSDSTTPLYFSPDGLTPGVLNNTGTFHVTGGGDFAQWSGIAGQTINNAGIWNVSGPGTTSIVNAGIAFHNTGTVNVMSGGFTLGGGDSGGTTGAFNVSSGALLNFNGGTITLGASSSISGAGAVIFSGGTTTISGTYNITGASHFTGANVTFDAPITSLGAGPLTISGGAVYFNSTTPAVPGINLSGGTLGGSAAVNATGDLTWTAGVMNGSGTTSVAGLGSTIAGNEHKWVGRTLTNSGTMTFSANDNATPLYFGPDLGSPGVLTNNGTFNVTGGGDFAQWYGLAGQAIHNAGIWNVSGAGTVSNVNGGIPFYNAGTVHVESGALALAEGLHGNGGTLEVDAGSTLTLGGTSTFTGASTVNSGTVIVTGNLTGTTGTFTTHGGTGGANGSLMEFVGSSTAGSGTFATHGGDAGGRMNFRDNASAGQGTFIASGHAGPALGDGARTTFFANSTAGGSTLIANGGSGGGAGGAIWFLANSTGGTARVQVFGNGKLDISGHSNPGMSIGSLEGTGNVFLGANNLSVGAGNLSTGFSGVIQNGGFNGGTGGRLTKVGTGTLTLGGANTYTGATHVMDGGLLINGNHSAATGSITVDALATLGGSGIIGGAVTLAGTLAPGNSAGLLTFNNTLTLAGTATTVMELGGLARGAQYDALNVGGLSTLAGTLQIQTVNNFLPQVGDSFTVLNYASRAGFFDAFAGFRIAPTLALQPAYTAGSLVLTVEARTPGAGDFDAIWTLPTDGIWQDATKWDSNPFYPDNGASSFDATIGATGSAYTVTLSTDISIANFSLTSAETTLAHASGVLEINHEIALQAGTYSLQGGTIKDATINATGGVLLFTDHGGNRLDAVTVNAALNLNHAGGARVRLQNGTTFTGGAHLGTPDSSISVLAYEQTGIVAGTTVHMDGVAANNYLNIEGSNTLTLGTTGIIRGQGYVGAQFYVGGANGLINQGMISADLSGRTMQLVNGLGTFTNTGIAQAINGATLEIRPASITNSGVFKATTGGTVEVYGATTVAGLGTLTNLGGTINLRGDMDNEGAVHTLTVTDDPVTLTGGRFFGGGTINATAGLRIGSNSNNRLDGVTLNGALNLNEPGGSWLRLQNGAAFTGSANLGSPDGNISVLAFEQNGVLDGVTVNMDGLNANTYLSIEGTNTLTVGPSGIIRGQGVIGNQFHIGGAHALVNQGLISADLSGRTLSLQASTFTNAGVLEAKNGATLHIPAGYTQTAGMTRLNNGTINSAPIDIVSGTLEGKGMVNANVASSGIINLDTGGVIAGTLDITGGSWDGQGAVTGLATTSAGMFTIGSGANMKASAGLFVTGSSTIAAVDATSTITGSVSYTASTASTFAGGIAGAGKTLALDNAAAVLTLTGPSTYTGGTTVTAGTLKAGIVSDADTGAFGWNSAVTMSDAADAILDITGFDTQIGSLTGGGANGGHVILGSATLTLGGDHTSPAPYAGTISGNGGITKAGIGTQTLTRVNTYTGATAVNGGTLQLDFASLVTPVNLIDDASPLALGGGALKVLGQTGSGVVTTQTLGPLTLTAGTNSSIILDPNNNDAGGTTLTLGNAWTRNAGASLLIDYSSTGTGTRIVKTSGPVTGTGAQSNGIFGYALVKDSGGIGFATQDGGFNIVRSTATGTVLTTSNSAAGSTATNFTTVSTDPDYPSVGGILTLDNVAHSANTLTIDSTGGGTLDLGGANGVLSLTSDALLMNGDDDYTIRNGALGASGSEVIVHQTGIGTLTISSPISGGTGSLTKDGSGTLTLTGSQNYATLTANGGTTNLEVPLGTGTSTLNANATTNVAMSQTLAALNIGADGVVVLGTAGPAFGEDFRLDGDAALFAGLANGNTDVLSVPGAVPEPGTCGLLGIGVLLLGLRRKRPALGPQAQRI